jgi:hypothetical protein
MVGPTKTLSISAKPSFFLIGAAKAGTTALCSLLDGHPQVGIADRKETHFFSDDSRYARGWSWYMSRFAHCEDKPILGDGSTSYSRLRYHPLVPPRIADAVPEPRIVYMVRHPLERMESAYVEHACTPGRPMFTSVNHAVCEMPMIVDSSRYWEVFDTYRKWFGEARVMVVWFEDWVEAPARMFREVCRFLGADDAVDADLSLQRRNGRADTALRLRLLGRPPEKIDTVWDPVVRQGVLERLRDDNVRFLGHFGKPRTYWANTF